MAQTKPATSKTAIAQAIAPSSEIVVRAIVAYPEIDQPNEDGKFQLLILVEEDSESADKLRALVRANLETLYPNGVPARGYWNPLRSGDETKGDGELAFRDEAFRGAMVARLKSKFKPKVVKGPHKDAAEADLVRSGDHCFVALSAYAYRNASVGVGLSLNSVWWIKPGERAIGGAAKGGASFGEVNVAGVDFAEE